MFKNKKEKPMKREMPVLDMDWVNFNRRAHRYAVWQDLDPKDCRVKHFTRNSIKQMHEQYMRDTDPIKELEKEEQ